MEKCGTAYYLRLVDGLNRDDFRMRVWAPKRTLARRKGYGTCSRTPGYTVDEDADLRDSRLG